jgi:hypothetical protein
MTSVLGGIELLMVSCMMHQISPFDTQNHIVIRFVNVEHSDAVNFVASYVNS